MTAAAAACVSWEGGLRSAVAQWARWAQGDDSAAWGIGSWGLLSMAQQS